MHPFQKEYEEMRMQRLADNTARIRKILEYVFTDQIARMDNAEILMRQAYDERREREQQESDALRAELRALGVTTTINTWNLIEAGFKDLTALDNATDEQLLAVKQVGKKQVAAIREGLA